MLRNSILAVCFLLVSIASASGETFKPFNLKTLEGDRKSLSDFAGKATLVVFFFPTCAYCNAAFPDVQKIYDKYKGQGLSMVWINAVPKEDRLVAGWKAKRGYTVPVLVGASMPVLQKNYALEVTPTYYLLDPAGTVLFRHASHKPGDEKTLEEQIQKALNVAPDRPAVD